MYTDLVYLQDKEFLKELDQLRTKEIFVKISVLDKDENPIREIQGQASNGQINIDGSSSVRRTGNINFIPDKNEGTLTDINNIISINKRIELKIGYSNTTNKYQDYDILWFPLGIYVITEASLNQSLGENSFSIQFQDKMCLLNGTCGGTFPAAVNFNTVEYVDASGKITIEEVPIYNIIQEMINHYAGEPLHKIIINDVPLRAKRVVKWTGENLLMLYNVSGTWLLHPEILEYPIIDTFYENENIGYSLTDFVYPGDLVAEAGDTIAAVLDKIKDTLGNYEYFYDINGNFVFQEIKNYLNTPLVTSLIDKMTNKNYRKEELIYEQNVYNFENNDLIISISNNPQYNMIKNDFVVWGLRESTTEGTVPIRYHLAIDKKPIPSDIKNNNLEDWRNVLYREGEAAAPLGLGSNYYYLELQNEWPKLYDTDNYVWYPNVLNDASSIDYFLDFIDSGTAIGELSVENIGRRSHVVNDNDVNCIFAPAIPSLIIVEKHQSVDPAHPDYDQYQEYLDEKREAHLTGMNYAEVVPDLYNEGLAMGVGYKDAFSVIRDLLYKYTNYNTSINLQTLPIYHLDVNSRIGIYDIDTGVTGDYIINSISVPLSVSENMSINAVSALQRI